MGTQLGLIRLESHPTARNRACATSVIHAGQSILAVEPLSTSLSLEDKGLRCDACHALGTASSPLFKCSRCASFWYCGIQCQSKQWKDHHRKICKLYNRYTASPTFQELSRSQRVDAILLSQLVAQMFSDEAFVLPPENASPAIVTFVDLLPMPGLRKDLDVLPICISSKVDVPDRVVWELFSRFGNNNFLLHSHLTTYAHGIYPVASRTFNHSCFPNSVTRYVVRQGAPVMMEVVALRDILIDEEVVLPYADPALPYDMRQTALRMNYGFSCICPLCTVQDAIGPVPPVPREPHELAKLEDRICAYVWGDGDTLLIPAKPTPELLSNMPKSLYPLLHSTYLPDLSERFSSTSHEGQYNIALSTGRTLLALYMVIYPPMFPQIGMHALELAKTAWNALSLYENDKTPVVKGSEDLEKDARSYLIVAHEVLWNLGPEGDEGGPLGEIRVLQELLNAPQST